MIKKSSIAFDIRPNLIATLTLILPVVFGFSIAINQNMLIFCCLIVFLSILTFFLVRAPEYAAYIAYMLIPFFYIPILSEQLWIGRIFLFYSLIFIFGRFAITYKSNNLYIGSITKFLIYSIIWFIIVGAASKNLSGSRRIILSYLTNTIMFSLLLQWVITDLNKMLTLMKFILLIGCISAFLAVLQAFFGDKFMISELVPIIRNLKNIDLYEEAYKIGQNLSASGLFLYRAKNVVFLILPWCLSAYYISDLHKAKSPKILFSVLLFFLIGAGFLSSGTRSVIVIPALCLFLLAYFIPERSNKKKLFILFSISIIGATAVMAYTSFNPLGERFGGYSGGGIGIMQLGMVERIFIFKLSLKFILSNPLFGIGLVNEGSMLLWNIYEAHNIFLDVGMHLGLFAMFLSIGLIIYIFMRYLSIIKASMNLKDTRLCHLTIIFFITFIGITAEGVIGFGFLSLKEGFPPYVAVMVMPDILKRVMLQSLDKA